MQKSRMLSAINKLSVIIRGCRSSSDQLALPGSPAVIGRIWPCRPLTLRPTLSCGLPFSDCEVHATAKYSQEQLNSGIVFKYFVTN